MREKGDKEAGTQDRVQALQYARDVKRARGDACRRPTQIGPAPARPQPAKLDNQARWGGADGGEGLEQQARRLLWNVCICPAGTRMLETRKRALGLPSRQGVTLRQRGWGGRLQSADGTRR